MELLFYFFVTLVFSTFFAMGGIGSAIALVSIFPMTGLGLNASKALALFVNTASMASSSFMNFKRGMLDMKFAAPIVFSVVVATPLGALLAQFVQVKHLNTLLAGFLFLSAALLLLQKPKPKVHLQIKSVLFAVGFFVGIISGMLGVGGGSLIMPLLMLLGYDAKKSAYAVSFVIPFSTLAAFFTYAQFIQIDYLLLVTVTVAAILGGYLGGKVMHYRLNQNHIRKLIALVLIVLALKITVC